MHRFVLSLVTIYQLKANFRLFMVQINKIVNYNVLPFKSVIDQKYPEEWVKLIIIHITWFGKNIWLGHTRRQWMSLSENDAILSWYQSYHQSSSLYLTKHKQYMGRDLLSCKLDTQYMAQIDTTSILIKIHFSK